MALIPPIFLDSVVAIGVKNEKGDIDWIGTGFIVGRVTEPDSNRYHTFLVTNKHVFDKQKKVLVRFNPQSNEKTKDFEAVLIDEQNNILWTGHPEGKIDVAVILINHQFLEDQKIKYSFFAADNHALRKSQLIESGISEGDFIYILGFPMNLVDIERNYVIVRLGIIARIKNYLDGFSKEFLVDSSVFPGNSGGPVITKPEIVAIQDTKAVSASNLIGMVESSINYQDVAYSLQTQKPRLISVENSGLTVIIPIDFILETIDIEYSKRFPKK
jgi:S1-C subfamily serine protease